MNDALIPALTALAGGTALGGGIYYYEARRDAQMRGSRVTYSLIFPNDVSPATATAALFALAGLDWRCELVSEVVADHSGIAHLIHVPEKLAVAVVAQLRSGFPGLRADPLAVAPTGSVTVAARITVPRHALLRTDEPAASARAVLAGLAGLHDGERVSLRWALKPDHAPAYEATSKTNSVSMRAAVLAQAHRARAGQPGFIVTGQVLVRAGSGLRARSLVDQVTTILRARRSVGPGLMVRSARVTNGAVIRGTGRHRGWLPPAELLGLLAWPIGTEAIPGVRTGAAREILVPRHLTGGGRVLFAGRDVTGEDRAVGISAVAATHHQAVVGPSGVGKSTLLAANLLSDLERGHGGVLIDPKADLVNEVADRVRPEDAERVVILDPASGGRIPGINALRSGDPDLASDVILGALAAVNRDNWGIRSAYYARLGLRALAELPDARLTDLGRLFGDARFRRQAVARLRDPLMQAAWQQYEQLPPGEAAAHVAPLLTKTMALLSRPAVRSVLAPSEPKLDIGRLLSERKWLLISLSPGTLGEPASRLLGSVLLYATWAAIEGRAALPKNQRREVFLYIDELATLADLPFGFELLAERSRGLGCGLVVAMQTISRLPDGVRRSLLGNVATFVTFRASAQEAPALAREVPGLTAQDLAALGAFEVAARIGTGAGSSVTVTTGRTLPPAAETGQAALIRKRSAELYGSDTHQTGEPLPAAHQKPETSTSGRSPRPI